MGSIRNVSPFRHRTSDCHVKCRRSEWTLRQMRRSGADFKSIRFESATADLACKVHRCKVIPDVRPIFYRIDIILVKVSRYKLILLVWATFLEKALTLQARFAVFTSNHDTSCIQQIKTVKALIFLGWGSSQIFPISLLSNPLDLSPDLSRTARRPLIWPENELRKAANGDTRFC